VDNYNYRLLDIWGHDPNDMADDFDAQLDLVDKPTPKPQFGRCKGKLVILAEDDEHLKDFDDYMPPKEN
jgi:hypothetical protein